MRGSSENLLYRSRAEIMATVEEAGLQISGQSLEALSNFSSQQGYFCTNVKDDPQSFIPWLDILYCQASDDDVLELVYVKHVGKTIKPVNVQIHITNYDPNSTAELLLSHILDKAYLNSTLKPRVLVLVNPNSGQGHAKKLYQQEVLPILNLAKVESTYIETKYLEHAVKIGKELDIDAFDIIACCSGDGIPHEFINGLYQRHDRVDAFNKLAITQLPCGSGNSMTLSTHGTSDAALATFKMLKSVRVKMDIMAVTQATLSGQDQVTKLSFLSQSYGVTADADIGTEHLRWLGPLRFDLGVLQKIISRTVYPCDLYINYITNDKVDIINRYNDFVNDTKRLDFNYNLKLDLSEENFKLSSHSLLDPPPENWKLLEKQNADYVSVLYVGKMPYILKDVQFFPGALPNDGSMDMVICTTNMSILESLGLFQNVDKGGHVQDKKVIYAKIAGYRLVPKKKPGKHYLSVDGESFPFEPLQVEVLPKVLTVLLQDGGYVLTGFKK